MTRLLRDDDDGDGFVEVARGPLATVRALLDRALPGNGDYDFADGVWWCGGDCEGGAVAPYALTIELVEDP